MARSESGEVGGRRAQVLRALAAAGRPVGIARLADELGVHVNTVRFHLEALLAAGQVEQVPPVRSGPGRPAALFRAVRRMDPTGPRHYRMLAELLAEALVATPDHQAREVAAGRVRGHHLAAARQDPPAAGADSVDRLVDLMADLGFAPERRGGQVALHGCPFLEAAEQHVEAVCPVHLGLMQGALAAWDSPVTVTELETFAEPDLCLARLAPAGAGHP